MLFYSYSWNSNKKWLQFILPPWLWENDSKAWIQFEVNWKSRNVHSASVKRQTVCFVKDPKFVVELDAKMFETTGHEQLNINLTKIEKSNSKLLVRICFYIAHRAIKTKYSFIIT